MDIPTRLPTLFLSHGSPMLALEDSPAGRFLDALGQQLPWPRAIVIASAHFMTDRPMLGGHAQPHTVHDFGGFPQPLYQIQYPAPGQPRVVEGEIPEQYRAEALEGEATRVLLAERAPEGLDWLFISPAGGYGAFAPGERTGSYRVGGEVALFDVDGGSNISGADFALAIVDEIETPRHHREHIGIAY